MTTWRMAFRVGNRGTSLWERCRSLGVAAITYYPVVDVDFSEYSRDERPDKWASLKPVQKSCLDRITYEMLPGDTILVKEGKSIVGRGILISSYFYDRSKSIIDENGKPWPHQVKVEWDDSFEKIDVLLGAEQFTILPLSAKQIMLVDRLEASKIQKSIDQIVFSEGQGFRAEVEFKYRNRDLVAMKKSSSDYSCEICGFSFEDFYGPIGAKFIEAHHRNPICDGQRLSTPGDILLLCSNCHSVVHRRNPPLDVDSVRKMILDAKTSKRVL